MPISAAPLNSSSYKIPEAVYAKHDGVYKEVQRIYGKRGGEYREIYNKKTYELYGFKFDSGASTAATAITYLEDAVGKTPAGMNMGSTTTVTSEIESGAIAGDGTEVSDNTCVRMVDMWPISTAKYTFSWTSSSTLLAKVYAYNFMTGTFISELTDGWTANDITLQVTSPVKIRVMFRTDPSAPISSSIVTGMTLTTVPYFSYGDWENAFFMPRPCMLKYDGTVDYYLDPNDYTKRVDISIPEDYKPVKYLKRTGNNVSYINTDIYINSYATTKADMAIKFENWYSSNDNASYIGANGGGERDIWVSNKSGTNQSEIFFWNGRGVNDSIVSVYAVVLGTLYNVHLGADYFAINDSKASVTPTPVETVLPGYPIVIFGRNNNGTIEAYNKTDLTIYNVVIRDVVNGAETITHFLIPAERQSDGQLGLYDAVTDVFYPATGTFTKGEYGIKSDCDNIYYGGNAMMEWPKIWYKFEAGENAGEGYFYVSDTKVDNTYHCWCNYDALDNEIEHFYTAIYNSPTNKQLRSLSGINLVYWDPYLQSLNGRAHANNVNGYVEWQLEVFADRQLIDALIMLIGKSANVTSVFGNGLYGQSGSAQALLESYTTGTLNDKGLFWGDTSSGDNAVKIFGMENWWGLQSRVVNGILYVTEPNAMLYYKLTYGTADGSETTGYDTSSILQFLSINTNGEMDRYTGYITALTFANGIYYPSGVSTTNNIWNWKFKPYFTYPQYSKMFTYGGNIWDSVRSPNGIELDYKEADDYIMGGNLCCKPVAQTTT